MNPPLFGKHILIIVENLPLPFDRRVWQEANSLKENGADVSIICPRMKNYSKRYEQINGIDIYRHPLTVEADGVIHYLMEYTSAIFWEWWYSLKIYLHKPFHVIQGCNPPDLIFLIAIFYKIVGVKYVFDHHDINPELYIAKYNKKGIFYNFLIFAERCTFLFANFSISTNESYKKIAIERGKMNPDKVSVIRSGPKLDRLQLGTENVHFKKGRNILVGYVGVIGDQEGLDLLMLSIEYIIQRRNDIQFAIIGSGTSLEKIKSMCSQMNLTSFVDFYGRVNDSEMVSILNTADICVNPDTPNIMNDLSTMNKIMEYMALKKPIVQYDLKEGRFSAKEASLYANNTDPVDFAEKIIYLADNFEVRDRMGKYGYDRVINKLSWNIESQKLISFYKMVFSL